MNNREFIVIDGSKSFFNISVNKAEGNGILPTFLELVKESDECFKKARPFSNHSDKLIITNDNYNGISEQAHDRIGSIIEEITTDDAIIYVHNPPITLKKFLIDLKNNSKCKIRFKAEAYKISKDKRIFKKNILNISKQIIGQPNAVDEITKSMWYLSQANRSKPYVVMLYGNSSIGKTELVREIATNFFNNNYLEKHLSMFKNNSYSDYFFGEQPNRKTLGYDLLERKSNLVFLDEIDKCPEHFHSAFYTLFDNTIFKDSSYEANISGLFITLTSNYLSLDDMKEQLGLPIFYRIDKFIKFDDFSTEHIYQILRKEISDRKDEFIKYYTEQEIYDIICHDINTTGENARTIKYKLQNLIENLLFSKL